MNRIRKVGDTYRPIVHIKKVKKGVPTILKVSGRRYILEHKDQYKGGKNNGTWKRSLC